MSAGATDFPRAQESTLTITGNPTFDLHVRIPRWADAFRLWVNGVEQGGPKTPGTFVLAGRQWRSGDTVRVAFPFKTRTEAALDNAAESYLKATGRPVWTAHQLGDLFKATGTPQGGDVSQRTGPLPDLRAALASVGPPAQAAG